MLSPCRSQDAGGRETFPSSNSKEEGMHTHILIAGTALSLSASPALAGGISSGGLRGMSGSGPNLLGGLVTGRATRASNSSTSCLCSTAGQAVRTVTAGRSISRMPANARGVRLLTNSVVGLNGLGAARGVGHGNGHGGGVAIGLAGVVTDGVGTVTTVGGRGSSGHGASLAGLVTGSVHAKLAGDANGRLANVAIANRTGSHGRSAVNVAALNHQAGEAGRVASVAVLNGTGPHGRSAVNVAALNGSAGTAGRVANVAILNGTGPHGRSAVNVAALNGTTGNSGKVVNVALLNGHGQGAGSGIRLINGVPCLPDGTPLTGPAAAAAMARLHSSPHHDGHHGANPAKQSSVQPALARSGPQSHQTSGGAYQVASATATRGSSGWDRRETPNKK
jgi:hypothetical protein